MRTVVEPDPKAGNLFERYRPDAPAKQAKSKRKCVTCKKWFTSGRYERHLETHK